MPIPTIVLSADNIRGALLLKTLQKNGFDVTICKNLFDSYESIKNIKPVLLVIDCEGLYQNELSALTSLSSLLNECSVLIVANKPNYSSLNIKSLSTQWCISSPLDLDMVITKAKELITNKSDETLKNLLPIDTVGQEDTVEETEEDRLEDDLIGYLGLK